VRWWRRLRLRTRLMIIGTGGLAAGFAIGGVLLTAALGYSLQRAVDSEALGTARDVAALVDAGALPQPVPVASGQIVQVVDARGRVRAASIGADRLVPLLRGAELPDVRAGHPRYLDGERAGVDGPLRVVAVPAGHSDDPQTVIVARPVAELARSAALLRSALLVAYPLLVLAAAALAWHTVGATLRPVEELRAGAEAITGAGGADRLPVPASGDEIHRLAVTLNDMLDRLVAAQARQQAFVADAAHELRSPLANMRTGVEVAQRLGDARGWPALAEDLLVDIQRLTRLVDDLLLLARADEHAALTRREPVDLAALAREVAGRHAGATIEVAGGPLWTVGDPDALTRIVANLVDNAVRYRRTAVRIEAVRDGSYARVSVIDDGPGIAPADRERVFDRFTRLDDARARGSGGAGLGLAIVRELVRRHGGTVTLADARPGLRADVLLPLDIAGSVWPQRQRSTTV
jgi:signal transduction histidine kinase